MTFIQNLKNRSCWGNFGKVGCKDMSSIHLAQDKNPVSGVMAVTLVLHKGREYFDHMS